MDYLTTLYWASQKGGNMIKSNKAFDFKGIYFYYLAPITQLQCFAISQNETEGYFSFINLVKEKKKNYNPTV